MKDPFEYLKALLLQGQKEIYLSGLKGSFFSYIISKLTLSVPRCFLVITSNNDLATEVCREVQFYLGKEKEICRPVLLFPSWETLPFDTADPHPEKVISRLETLYYLQKRENYPIIISPLRALMQHCIPPDHLKKAVISGHCQDVINYRHLVERLVVSGYRDVPLVEERGEFSVRGGILDVFPPLYSKPIRLEFFGDRVESIRQFSPVTQRSLSNLEQFYILPVSEVILDEASKRQALKSIETLQKKGKVPSVLSKLFKEKLEQNGQFPAMAFLLEFFYENLGSLPDYLPPGSLVWFYGIPDLTKEVLSFFETVTKTRFLSRAEGKLSSLGDNLYLTPEETQEILMPFSKIWIDSLEVFSPEKNIISFSSEDNKDIYQQIVESRTRGRPLVRLARTIQEWLNENYIILFSVYSDIQKKRIQKLLEQYGLVVHVQEHYCFLGSGGLERGKLVLTLGLIRRGFRSPTERVIVLTEGEIFGEKISRDKKSEVREGYKISDLTDLQIEDFVVHIDYGIGKYKGLHSLEINGNRNDYLLIEYRNGDRLYVPVYRLNLVQKYRGVEGRSPTLNKLGGKTWLQTKKRVKKSIQTHAKELLRIYAARQALKGFSFSPGDQYYQEFEARFEYEETRDQANAIEDVVADMESSRPMDRLICGDVGYGKTEVALRASFKAVMDNKQVAVLVPTTILAYQHFQTFTHRFRDFPVNIAMMSRFQTPRQQKDILHQLKEGKVDIVIGTHRLLQKDIGFKSLGLVVIDEEHRFGVNHKEKLKKLRKLVDVLALTATPIPRTLQLSLLGIRDLSIIDSPPQDRLAIRTYITGFDDKIIREAIIREFLRDGQVFFVHNRVGKIEAMADYLKELIPEASLAIAHGQMPEKELEEVMLSFHRKRVNLLLCTSIIESGLDFPHANTIIVNQAHKLGLAQLYQLRGRVGRSSHQAYAYFLIPQEPYLTGKAKERLKVIAEFSTLSSGFRLAKFDLELRGGGNILGFSQSGHMAQLGIELYYQLIEKAVKEVKGEKIIPDVDPEIRLEIPAYIPEDYIPDIHQRLKIYRKISGGIGEIEIPDVENELQDRFGPLPLVVKNLLVVSSLKPVLRKFLVTSLGVNGKDIVLVFHPEAEKSLNKIITLIQNRKGQLKFTPDYQLHIPFPFTENWEAVVKEVKKILQ